MVSVSYNKRSNKMIMVDVQFGLWEIILLFIILWRKEKEKSTGTEQIKISNCN